nr:MAG TPA: hypothetical protein [Caudoviricetes sp.]
MQKSCIIIFKRLILPSSCKKVAFTLTYYNYFYIL